MGHYNFHMTVLARDLNQKIPKEDAYKGEDGRYYSSRQGYIKANYKKYWNTQCENKLIALYNRPLTYIPIKTIRKKFRELSSFDYRIIHEVIIRRQSNIKDAIDNKDMYDDTLVSYIFGIINNSYNDVVAELRTEKKVRNTTISSLPHDIEVKNPIHKVKDIRSFL